MMEALLELHPDDFWATLAMTWLPQRLNRPEVARRYTIKLADMRPNDFRANYDAADAYLEQGDEERARPYIERAIKLPKQDSISEVDAWRAAELDFFPVYSKWFRGDTDGAYAEVQQLVATADSQPVAFRHAFARHLADAHLAFGELKAAESACSLISELDWQHYCLCTPAFERGDREAYRTHRRRAPPAPKSWATIRLAYLRLPAETRAELKVAEGRRFVPGWVESARAILLLHEGHKQAAADLEEAARQLRSSNTSNALYATEALAAFHEENGDLTNAIRVLEEAESVVSRSRKLTRGAGIALLRVRARLAALYRKTGRVKEAEEIERDLRKRLKYADADHPLVVQLNAVQETTVARSR
jgi:tetratricopeptide (TPR) repeat protein